MTSVKNLDQILFTEKYRPETLDKCILPARIKKMLEGGIKMNMMFYGTAGIGKTTTAKALAKQFKHNTLYINCSEDTGIDTIRETVTDFCMNQSILHYDNPIKVVILDEFDGMSQASFKILRSFIETHAANTRFLACCNYIERIPSPIQSRFQMIDFNFTSDEMIEIKKGLFKRVIEICNKEGMTITKEAALKMVQTYYPDFRSIINHLQRYKLEGKTELGVDDIKDSASEYAELYDMIITQDNPVENYKFVMKNYSNCVDEAIAALGYPFVEYILKSKPNIMDKIPVITILNAKYQQNLKNCIDPVVVLLANIFELQTEIQK